MNEPGNIAGVSFKSLRRLLLSFSNLSRAVFISLIGLVINYILIRYKSREILDSYVYCIAVINVLMVFCNWGAKDYSVRYLSSDPGRFSETLGHLLTSRVILFLPALLVVLLIPANVPFKFFIALYLMLKSFTSVFESVITVQKKFVAFLFIDFVLNVVLVATILLDRKENDVQIFFAELLIIEFLRFASCFLLFKKFVVVNFDLKKSLSLIGASKSFFFVALAGFVCSKADLYAVGIVMKKEQMSLYFIIINLVGLSQVAYATLVGTYSANIFRYSADSFRNFSVFSLKAGALFSLVSWAGVYVLCNYYYKIPTGPFFSALIFVNIFLFTLVLTQMYHFTRLEKQPVILRALIFSGVINVVLSLLLSGPLGQTGAFLSNTLGSLCTLICFKLYDYYAKDQRFNSHV